MSSQAAARIGIVSNCWRVQLDEGQTLDGLIEEAVRRQFYAVELRQGFLGEYESHAAEALTSSVARKALANLSSRFPMVEFNLAVSLPSFGGEPLENDVRFEGALAAAMALSLNRPAHLRLVDTETRTLHLDSRRIAQAGLCLAGMAQRLTRENGFLSVEHAYQCWPDFWSTFQRARLELGSDAFRLRCCFDPCNLLLTEPVESIPSIVDSISLKDVSMIHLKQRNRGQIQPDVAAGELDWPLLLQLLRRHGHEGPWLFEVAPHSDIWTSLDRSRQRFFS